MIQPIIFIAASIAFALGVIADATSSIGLKEKTPFFRDKQGMFDLKRYLLSMIGLYVATLVIVLLAKDMVTTIMGCGVLIMGAVVRFRIARKNRAIRAKAGQP